VSTTTEMGLVTETGLGTKTREERKELLASAVANQVRFGWRIESQTDYQAVIVKGNRPNHVLHLLLTIFTLGLWGIVWIAMVAFGGEKRGVIGIDEYGNTNIQR
jgi:hypothetical protein